MHVAESRSSISDTDGPIEVQLPYGTLRFGTDSERRDYVESTDTQAIKGGSCAPVPEPVSESSDDVLAVGAMSIADIEKLMEELQIARDYLQSEGERVRLVNARYGHLAQTASASAKIIAKSLGKWRNSETADQSHGGMPTADQSHGGMPRAHAPALSPVDNAEPHHESNDQ